MNSDLSNSKASIVLFLCLQIEYLASWRISVYFLKSFLIEYYHVFSNYSVYLETKVLHLIITDAKSPWAKYASRRTANNSAFFHCLHNTLPKALLRSSGCGYVK